MPSLYLRETRPIELSAVPPALREAIVAWGARHQVALDSVTAWHTHSVNPPGEGLLARLLGRRANPVDPDTEHDAVLVLHPTHLIVGTLGARRGVSVLGAPIMQCSVTRGSLLAARLGGAAPTDDGITLSGFPGAEGRPGTYFFGLGGAGSDSCFAAVESAVRARKNP